MIAVRGGAVDLVVVLIPNFNTTVAVFIIIQSSVAAKEKRLC